MQVDPVEQGTADPLLVFLHGAVGAGALAIVVAVIMMTVLGKLASYDIPSYVFREEKSFSIGPLQQIRSKMFLFGKDFRLILRP